MQKYNSLLLSAFVLVSTGLVISSCKDDEPYVKPKLSFGATELTAKESDPNLQIQLVLDKPASEDVTVTFSLTGSAVDDVTAGSTNANADYVVVSDYEEVEILKGETTGIIELNVLSDQFFENNETIEISIDNVSTDGVEITRDDQTTITLTQEDGMVILLEWPNPSADGYADMDIVVRAGSNPTTWTDLVGLVYTEATNGQEVAFVPSILTFPSYGVSYPYYDGTIDTLDFTATFIEYKNATLEAEAQTETFDGRFFTANKNKWEDPTTTIVVQTFGQAGGVFSSPTQITTPAMGSRIGGSIDNTYAAVKKRDPNLFMSDKLGPYFHNLNR